MHPKVDLASVIQPTFPTINLLGPAQHQMNGSPGDQEDLPVELDPDSLVRPGLVNLSWLVAKKLILCLVDGV